MSLKDAIREAVDARDKPGLQADLNPANLEAVNAVSSNTVNTASSNAAKQAEQPTDELAAMTVRVSRRYRLHWLIAAKRQGTTLTAAITEAMNARFGEPDE